MAILKACSKVVLLKRIKSHGAHFGGRIVIALALGCYGAAACAEWRPYFISEVFARSEPNSVMDAIGNWKGDYQSGERQYLVSRFEAGVKTEHWGLGLQHRWDYGLSFSPDAAEFYGAVRNDKALDSGRVYDVDLKANVIESSGLRFSRHDLLLPTLKTEFGLTLLRSHYMIDGSLTGQATATGDKAYTYTAWADYAYTDDVLFGREVGPQTGYGFSLDAHIDWQFQPQWRMDLQLRDLPGWVWWDDLPYTQATAQSQRTHTDSNGFKQWDPLVSGYEKNYSTYRQTLPLKAMGDLYFSGWPVTVAAGASYQFEDLVPRVGTGKELGEWRLFGWYWPRDQALGVDIGWNEWKVGLAMDNIRWDDAHFITVTLAYNY